MKREKKEKAPKPKKEKKPKKPKKEKPPKKRKKGAAPDVENPEGAVVETGKKGKKKLLIILLPVLILAVGAAVFFFVIRPKLGGEKEVEVEEKAPEPVETPLMYTVGESEIHALPVWGESTVYLEEQEMPAGDGEDELEPTAVTYRYEGLSSPGTLASVYTTLLTAEDIGFSQVDEELIRIKEPEELVLEAGSVRLAKNAPEEEKALLIQMDWTEELCTVTADLVDGRVKNPPEPVSPAGPAGLSEDQALDYIQSLSPAVLGLEGATMEDYDLLVQEGSVLIDGNPCIRINAYQVSSQTGTNEIGGNYFLSLDGAHLYRLDVASNSVEELDTPQ